MDTPNALYNHYPFLTEETSTEYDATEPIQEIKNVGGEPDSGRALRIARKLGTGALWGIVPSYAEGFFLKILNENRATDSRAPNGRRKA